MTLVSRPRSILLAAEFEVYDQSREGIMKYILGASVVVAGILASSIASAATYVVSEVRSPVLACYVKVYVPATVKYNTRGIKVQGESVGWLITGDRWEKVRNPAVYIETAKTIEADHYKLVPCR